jgi:PAS domain S-box-containing protein
MRRTVFLLVLVFMCFCLTGATPVPPPSRSIRVGVYENAPKIFVAPDGTVSGFWPDLIRSIADREGWEIVWVHGTWDEGLAKLAANTIDMMPDTAWTEERSQAYAFSSETVLLSWSRLYVPKGSTIESILDLDGKTVAGLSGSTNLNGPEGIKDLTTRFGVRSTFVEMTSYTQVFEALEKKQADAGITNRDFGNLNEGKYDVVRTPIVFQPVRIMFAFPKDGPLTPYLSGTIDSQIAELRADPHSAYYQALDKHLGQNAPGAVVEVIPGWLRNLLALGGVVFVFVLSVMAISRLEVRRKTAELQKQRSLLQAVIHGTTDVIFAKDTRGRYILLNSATETATGKPAAEVLGQDDRFVIPEGAEEIIRRDRDIMTARQVSTFEESLHDANGQLHTFLTTKGPLLDEAGTVLGVFGIARDITQRVKTEEELRRWEQMFQSSGWGMVLTNPSDHVILAANPALAQMHGYEPGELKGMNLAQLLAPDAIADLPGQMRLVDERGHHTYVSTHVRKDGACFPTLASVNVIKDSAGTVLYRAANVQDITAHVLAEKQLRDSEQRYRTLAGISPVGIFRTDAAGLTTYLSPTWCQISGLSFDEALGEGWLKAVHPDDRPNLTRGWHRSALHHSASLADYRFVRPDGAIVWVMGNAVPEMDSEGHVTGYVGTITDITERKRDEAALQRSLAAEHSARRLAETIQVANQALSRSLDLDLVLETLLDQLGQLVPYDSANVMLLQDDPRLAVWASRGYAPGTGDSHVSAFVQDYRAIPVLRAVLEGQQSVSIADTRAYPGWEHPAGAGGVISWLGVPLVAGGKSIGIYSVDKREAGFFTDEYRLLAEALAGQAAAAIQNANLLAQVQRSATDLEARAKELAALNFLGREVGQTLSADSVVSTGITGMQAAVEADVAIFFMRDGDRLIPRGVASPGDRLKPEDLAEQSAGADLYRLALREKQARYTREVLQDERIVGEGDWGGPLRSFAALPLLSGGNAIGVVGLASHAERDFERQAGFLETLASTFAVSLSNSLLHEQVQQYAAGLEQRVAERTAELAERVSEVENLNRAMLGMMEDLKAAVERAQSADQLKSAFLATMSHELRTPLNSIIGFTGILLQGLVGALNEEQTKQLGMVQRSARHLLDLINDVLDISKIEAGQIEIQAAPFSVDVAIQKCVETIAPLARKKGLELIAENVPSNCEIVSDRRRVEQILINLLNNAIKFTLEGEVRLESRVEDGWLITSVKDTGIGIKAQDMDALFRPFRQIDSGITRQHEGTGLGLSICRRLVEILGGTIGVESEWGRGSTFTFTLPLDQGAR